MLFGCTFWTPSCGHLAELQICLIIPQCQVSMLGHKGREIFISSGLVQMLIPKTLLEIRPTPGAWVENDLLPLNYPRKREMGQGYHPPSVLGVLHPFYFGDGTCFGRAGSPLAASSCEQPVEKKSAAVFTSSTTVSPTMLPFDVGSAWWKKQVFAFLPLIWLSITNSSGILHRLLYSAKCYLTLRTFLVLLSSSKAE